MCDDDSFDDMISRRRELSRRELGALTIGAGIAFAACGSEGSAPAGASGSATASTSPAKSASGSDSPATSATAGANATAESDVTVTTPDGSCDAYFVHPTKGAAAAVLVWPDIFGLRPAFRQMGKRLAESGYAVLVVNPFYRTKKAPTSTSSADFEDPAKREALMALAKSLTPETQFTDAKAFTAWLDAQAAVDKARKMGTTGYCMGGPLVLRTAATNPERIGAGATFHGGGLVTDAPESPHLLIPKMKAQFLIAIAENDDAKQPDGKDKLKTAFEQASLKANVEVFAGTKHGWCPPDAAVYDRPAAEKAWSEMLDLFKGALA